MDRARLAIGVGVALLAALLLVATDVAVSGPVTILIVGLAVIATSRRRD